MIQNGTASRSIFTATVVALLAAGCGGSSGSRDASQGVSVTVTPPARTLLTQGSVQFDAAVTGAANTAVSWSVTGGPPNGTVTNTGLYTAPSTTGTFQVVATSQADTRVSGSASVTVVTTPPPPVGAQPMTTANRTSGVAPLSVFFDAVNDVAASSPKYTFAWSTGVTQPADMEGATWAWDFGDPGAGTWSTTGRSKNVATGYTAAHVYEMPGSYTVTLSVTQTDGSVATYTQTVTVGAFSGATYYAAATPVGSQDGSSAANAGSFANGMTWVLAASNRRLLLKRGDTFGVTQAYRITTPGPGIIGAYGTGNKPLLMVPDLGDANVLSPGGAGSDWRIMDIELRGPSADQASWTGALGPAPDQQMVNALFLRVSADRWNNPIGWSYWAGTAAGTPSDGVFIVECEVWNHYNVGLYIGGRRIALLGNSDHDGLATHLVRMWQGHKAVISNNSFLRPGGQRHCIKLHGIEPAFPTAPETRWVSITDNLFEGSATSQWTVSMGSQSDAAVEAARVSHVMFERNRFASSATTVADIESEASNVIIRNNVFDDSQGADVQTIIYSQRNAGVPTPTDCRIYNNTVYKSTSAAGSSFLATNSTASNVRVRNNLWAGNGVAAGNLVSGAAGSGWAADHNLAATAPGFTNAAAGDYSLVTTSPAVDAGATLPEVIGDIVGGTRPKGAADDVGAYESH